MYSKICVLLFALFSINSIDGGSFKYAQLMLQPPAVQELINDLHYEYDRVSSQFDLAAWRVKMAIGTAKINTKLSLKQLQNVVKANKDDIVCGSAAKADLKLIERSLNDGRNTCKFNDEMKAPKNQITGYLKSLAEQSNAIGEFCGIVHSETEEVDACVDIAVNAIRGQLDQMRTLADDTVNSVVQNGENCVNDQIQQLEASIAKAYSDLDYCQNPTEAPTVAPIQDGSNESVNSAESNENGSKASGESNESNESNQEGNGEGENNQEGENGENTEGSNQEQGEHGNGEQETEGENQEQGQTENGEQEGGNQEQGEAGNTEQEAEGGNQEQEGSNQGNGEQETEGGNEHQEEGNAENQGSEGEQHENGNAEQSESGNEAPAEENAEKGENNGKEQENQANEDAPAEEVKPDEEHVDGGEQNAEDSNGTEKENHENEQNNDEGNASGVEEHNEGNQEESVKEQGEVAEPSNNGEEVKGDIAE